MPLLRKKPFQKLHVSSDFKDDDEVFYCAVTNEIFKDYNEFCERIILCNSMIWSCSITGKSGMTYEEALQCEDNAKKSLKEFPMELRIPILYLANKTSRNYFSDMIEDVFQYARERYFIGEMVEASFEEDSWCECHILQVIEPNDEQIKTYNVENLKSPMERQYNPPAKLFRYEVEQLDSNDSDVSQLMIVEASQIRRKKQQYSRERNKIFLRMLCEQSTTGKWAVKENILEKYGINKVRFDSIFAGPQPDFTPKPKKMIKQKQESLDKFLISDPSKQFKQKLFDKPDPLKKINNSGIISKKIRKPRLNGKFKEELKAKVLEEKKAKREEEKLEKQERKKEEKLKQAALAAYVKSWNKLRDDLECEDLRPIPEPVPVEFALKNDKFGDIVLILEFLQSFYDELEVKKWFSSGLNLELLEKALSTREIAGPFNDLVHLLLANIFKFQGEEEDEIDADDDESVSVKVEHGISSMAEAVILATKASTWSQTHQGCQISELTLDALTLSEILRQHLLSSGGRISEKASKWRYSQRGGYTNHDDPALLLRIEEPHILRTLSHRNICEFDIDDKLTLIICLINQLLTFASIRDVLDERSDRVQQAKKDLKLLIQAELKREREEKEKLKEKEKEGKLDEEDHKPKIMTRSNCEDEKRKEEYEMKLKELQSAAKDEQMMVYLGSDRAYRKYYRLLSIPGLFVENVDLWPGECLPDGTPFVPGLQDKQNIQTYLKAKFEDECSDKENSFKKEKKSPKKILDKTLSKSPRKDFKICENMDNDLSKQIMACTDNDSCPVHYQRLGCRWTFYSNSEDIDKIIEALNDRGFRESELKNNFVNERESLIMAIEECPKYKLNSMFKHLKKESTNKTSSKKNKYENTNLNFPANVALDDVLELTLRDYVLDLEEKLKVGCLGTLKVNNREIWRNAIMNRKYDKQCERLVFTNEIEVDVTINLSAEKIKHIEMKNNRPETPDSEAGSGGLKAYCDPGNYLGLPAPYEITPDSTQQKAIKQMACAILQISQAIDNKFMQKPLTDDVREKWEQSLVASTSWSQLFVHLNTLENGIAWDKSALNAQCRICRKRKDAESMLLCDGCNKGHHLYCLKPVLMSVPEGDWFCQLCSRGRETTRKEKIRKRRKFDDYDCEEETTLTKETRHSRARRVLDSENEEEKNNGDSENETNDEEACSVCQAGGKLISCSVCSNAFHIDCLEPPLLRPPRGNWTCIECIPTKINSLTVKGRERDKESERSSAAAARSRIHGFAKSLLSKESKDWDDVSMDVEQPRHTRRSAKRAAEADQVARDKYSIKSVKTILIELLSDIKKHRDSWPFMYPVTKEEVPDYHDYISNPMDFGTIKTNLEKGNYQNLEIFFQDCILVFDNCRLYNAENSNVYKAGMRLLKFFEKRCKDHGLDFNEDQIRQSNPKIQKLGNTNFQINGAEDSDVDLS